MDFNDSRLFGELRLVNDWRQLKFVKELGPEPFEISCADFKKKFLSEYIDDILMHSDIEKALECFRDLAKQIPPVNNRK